MGSRRNLSELIRVLMRGMVGIVLDMVVEFEFGGYILKSIEYACKTNTWGMGKKFGMPFQKVQPF